MAARTSTYDRLSATRTPMGLGGNALGGTSLWAGETDLLCVENNGYSEAYSRISYADIQAFTIRQTTAGMWWNWSLGAICVLALYLVFIGGVAGWTVAVMFGVPAVVGLAVNVLRGPTCVCVLHTAVQARVLPSLARVRTARRVVDRVRELVLPFQADLPAVQAVVSAPEHADLRARIGMTAEGLVAPHAAIAGGQRDRGGGRLLLHQLAAAGLVVHGALFLGLLLTHLEVLVYTVCIISVLLLLLVLFTVGWQARHRVSPGLQRLSWASAGFLTAVVMAGYMYVVVMSSMASAGGAVDITVAFVHAVEALAARPWRAFEIGLLWVVVAASLLLGMMMGVAYVLSGPDRDARPVPAVPSAGNTA